MSSGNRGRRSQSRGMSERQAETNPGLSSQEQHDDMVMPGTTGRYLVLLREDSVSEAVSTLTKNLGVKVVGTSEAGENAVQSEELSSDEAIIFDNLGVAVVNTPPDKLQALSISSEESNSIMAVEPERIVYALSERPFTSEPAIINPGLPSAASIALANNSKLSRDYLVGYRDAVDHLIDQLLGTNGIAADLATPPSPLAEAEVTWGLQLTGVTTSRYSGRGVRVAILDTGFDLNHPDFAGRRIVSQSFVDGEPVQDRHGHGTHCVGTACGPLRPTTMPRYGIAYDAEIYVGKVLSNRGSGTDTNILAGISWAISQQCSIVSMSLGAPVAPGQTFSRVYEAVARRALAAGTLIIAAAGNESQRPGRIAPVGHPANCPSIIAVAAIDSGRKIAVFSCGGVNLQGGQVDISGPGVDVYSSWPQPQLYRRISGTSMATPHVAGIAALHAEANPDVRGGALGWLLLQSALRMDMSAQDIGAGLVQAP